MRQSLALAMRGRGAVEPNPMVGCILHRDGRTIGQGYHARFGQPHAEPEALRSCTEPPGGATAYVTLEPCCHTNKKTPPCVPALIASGVARVVVACADPNPAVAGQGIEQLRQAGIHVDVGILENEARQLNAAFFAQVLHRRPYVTLKWAQSADGKVARPRGQRMWISNERSRRVVHELRARCDAILVGINTVLADDPLLTARGVANARPLMRLVLDCDLRLPADAQLVGSVDAGPVRVYCSNDALARKMNTVSVLMAEGIELAPLPVDQSGQLSLPHLLADLGRQSVTHLLVEPGPTLAESFLTQTLADRVWLIRSPRPIGDAAAPAAQLVSYPVSGETDLEGDRLTEHLNPGSAVFYTLAPSADLQMASGK